MSWESKCVSRGNIGHSIGQNWSWRNLRNWGWILNIFLIIGFNINIFGERWKTDIILTCLSTGETGVAILAMWFSPEIWKIYTKLKIVSQTIFFSDTHESEVKRCPSVNGESQCDVHVSPRVVASRAVERREVSIEEFKWESSVCLDVPSHGHVHVYMCKTAEKDKEKKYLENQQEKGLTCTTRWVRELYRRLSPP